MEHTRRVHAPTALLAAALITALIAFAYLGTFTRYMGDDYCQAAEARKFGFVRTQVRSYTNWSGRFASSASITAAVYAGPRAAAFLPALLLALWLAGAAWAVRQFSLLTRRPLSLLYCLLLAALLVFATVNGAHDVALTLYWQAGLLTYVPPLALLTFGVGATLAAARLRLGGRSHWPLAALGAALAFAAAGFSESFALMQTGGLALAAAACFRHRKTEAARAAFPAVAVSLAGSLLALVLVMLAPGNDLRQGYFPQPPEPLRVAWLSLFYAAAFVPYTIYLSPLNSLLAAVLPAWLGARFAADGRDAGPTPAGVTRRLAIAVAVGMFLIVLCVLPAAYGMSQNLPARARIIPQFVFVCVTAYCGYLAGSFFSTRLRDYAGRVSRLAPVAAVVLVCLMLLPAAAAVVRVGRLIPLARESADVWDRMDAEVRAARERGETELVVETLDDVETRFGGVSGGAFKLEKDPSHRRNWCAARYYGVRSIRSR